MTALYAATKEFEAVATVSADSADRLRRAVETSHAEYLSAKDFAVTESDRALVSAYGDALPSMRVTLHELKEGETWARLANEAGNERALRGMAETAKGHSDKAFVARDQAKEHLAKAHLLYLAYMRPRDSQ